MFIKLPLKAYFRTLLYIMERKHEGDASRLKVFFKKDCSRFRKYIKSSTPHGVVHIFIGKSKIRKAFWLLIVLACAAVCLHNVIERIRFLASAPSTTTIKITRNQQIDFPAVTICSLNMLEKDYLKTLGLDEIVPDILLSESEEHHGNCSERLREAPNLPNITYQQMFASGKHDLETLIVGCLYLGRDCSVEEDFVPVFTKLGVCYVFNSGQNDTPIMRTSGTGAGLGLRLVLNISQSQYAASSNLDAGVKIVVHHQSEPPWPQNKGIAVPPGTNAFISIRQLNIVDETEKSCNPNGNIFDLNFFRRDHSYSSSACAMDCFYTQVAESCNCILSDEYPPDKEPFKSLRLCTIWDICCVLWKQTIALSSCTCSPPCRDRVYEMTSSYSAFPAMVFADKFRNNASALQDLLMVNIFYETLSITDEVTSESYNTVALLSDIGGQLGLFLGISVISVVEFAMWLLDEIKDRCLGISERKMRQFYKGERGIKSEILEMKEEHSKYYVDMNSE